MCVCVCMKTFRDFTNTCHAILRSLFYEELGDIRPAVTAQSFLIAKRTQVAAVPAYCCR